MSRMVVMPSMKTICPRLPPVVFVALAGWVFTATPTASAQSFFLSLSWNGPEAAHPIEGSWPTVVGQEYFIEATSDLAAWALLPVVEIGDGAPTLRPLPWEADTRQFFRVWQLPPSPADRPWVTPEAATSLAKRHLFRSALIGRPVSFHAMMPPSYDTEPDRRYPVLYWLHGANAGIVGIAALSQFFHNAMADGRMPHAIVVMANGLSRSMWCDSKDGSSPVESVVINELVPQVDRNFRTIASRVGRIVEGFSMGGYGAGRLGLKYADHFRACSLFGAGPLQLDFLEDDPDLAPIEWRRELFAEIYDNDMDYYLAQHPWTWAETRAGQLPSDHRMRMVIGTADSLLANNRKLRDHLMALGIDHDYLELPGVGHNAMQTLAGAGPSNWAFYRETLSATE
jgi:enterochelin esterase-like enzyme